MYYPYLRGKQNELIAIREVNERIYNGSNKVTPIIELPSTEKRGIKANFKKYVEANIPFILIVNPQIIGDRSQNRIVEDIINDILSTYDNYFVGYIISNNTTMNDVENFITEFRDEKKTFIHNHRLANHIQLDSIIEGATNVFHNIFLRGKTDEGYENNFSQNIDKIIVQDGFIKARINAEYPQENYFYNLPFTYREQGYDGFGDYLTIGESFKLNGGGAARTVALHLTYHNSDGVWVRHTLSDDREDTTRTPAKFMEALTHLITFLNDNTRFDITSGSEDFRQFFDREHYPGLGTAKKISIKHHMEYIHSLL
jgi:hypothetical protein